jgi:hypothetical protein
VINSANVDSRRPDPRYYDVQYVLNASHGYFDAGKVTLTAPRWHGVVFDVSYWLSKAIDTGSDYTNRASGQDATANRSQTADNFMGDLKAWSSFDQPHAFISRVTWETPRLASARGHLNAIFGQWQVSAVALKKSGTPFGLELNSDAPPLGNGDGVRGDRPNLLDPSVLGRTINNPDTAPQLLPVAAFGPILPGQTRGNIGNTTFRKDGVHNINLGISRRWTIQGERSLTFQADSLNLTNTPQFAAPGFSWPVDNFGQITNTLNDGRTVNLTLRLAF